MRARHLPCLLLLLLATGLAGQARAHVEYRPFSSNRYLELDTDAQGLRLAWWLTVGDMPASRLRKRFDADSDGTLSEKEQRALKTHLRFLFADGVFAELDGEQTLPRIRIRIEEFDLTTSLVDMFAPLRMRIVAQVACPPGAHRLRLADRSRPSDAGQSELVVKGLNLRQSRLEAGAPEPSLRENGPKGYLQHLVWEEGKTGRPLRLVFDHRPEKTAGNRGLVPPLADEAGPLKAALADAQLGMTGMLIALLLAFGLGALHALSPGHGKTLVAAYLVGSKGKVRHAVLLGGVVTLTHVGSVFVLGAVALWASERMLPEELMPWMSLAAGVLVLGMGLWMLRGRLKDRKGHTHHHHHHHHHHQPGQEAPRMGELLTLGISGGLVPCPSATVVLLLAIYMGRILLGLGLLLAFSAGLAFTLVLIGVLVVQGRKWLERFGQGARTQRLIKWLPVASALIVSGLGVWLTAAALSLTLM